VLCELPRLHTGKESTANAGDVGCIPGWGRSPGGGNGNLFQYSCLENPMDRRAWWVTVHGIKKSQMWLSSWACTHIPVLYEIFLYGVLSLFFYISRFGLVSKIKWFILCIFFFAWLSCSLLMNAFQKKRKWDINLFIHSVRLVEIHCIAAMSTMLVLVVSYERPNACFSGTYSNIRRLFS